jgi:prepilin-type N-terminal cleavage/methylation domain-containing protein/prepilin-type processing-associated H-X9-DG protein
MKPCPPRSGCASGFSLIELLVVIAIIAILASLLLTGVSTARRLSKSMVCQSNLRQLFTGLTCYATDWSGRMMVVSDWNGVDYGPGSCGQTWGEVLASVMELRPAAEPVASLSELGIFRCPENAKQRYQMQWGPGSPQPTKGSYGGNGWYQAKDAGLDGQFFGCQLSRIRHASELLVMVDCSCYRIYPANELGVGSVPYLGMGIEFARYAHGGQANAVYADGHNASMRMVEGRGAPTRSGSFPAPCQSVDFANGRAWYVQ